MGTRSREGELCLVPSGDQERGSMLDLERFSAELGVSGSFVNTAGRPAAGEIGEHEQAIGLWSMNFRK